MSEVPERSAEYLGRTIGAAGPGLLAALLVLLAIAQCTRCERRSHALAFLNRQGYSQSWPMFAPDVPSVATYAVVTAVHEGGDESPIMDSLGPPRAKWFVPRRALARRVAAVHPAEHLERYALSLCERGRPGASLPLTIRIEVKQASTPAPSHADASSFVRTLSKLTVRCP